MTTQNEDRDFVQTDWFDPFPEPRTIPSGWDLSEFFSTPQTDSVIENDSNTDREYR
jgi:hypothetical protein